MVATVGYAAQQAYSFLLLRSNIHYDDGISNSCPCHVGARMPILHLLTLQFTGRFSKASWQNFVILATWRFSSILIKLNKLFCQWFQIEQNPQRLNIKISHDSTINHANWMEWMQYFVGMSDLIPIDIALIWLHQWTVINKDNHTTSTKCQYHAVLNCIVCYQIKLCVMKWRYNSNSFVSDWLLYVSQMLLLPPCQGPKWGFLLKQQIVDRVIITVDNIAAVGGLDVVKHAFDSDPL